jgi:signal transduction histidine kinase
LVASWDRTDRLAVRATTGIGDDERVIIHQRYQALTKQRFAHWTHPFKTALVEDVYQHEKIEFDRRLPYPRSLAEVPVVVGDELWGFFSIGWSRQRTFNEEDRRLFDAFAARASLAIQNAMLFEETARRSSELEALYRADEALHRSLRREDVLQVMMDLSSELLGAESSLVAVRGEDDVMQVIASRGLGPAMLEAIARAYQRDKAEQTLPRPAPRMGLVEDINRPGVNPELPGGELGSYAEIPVFVQGQPWGVFSIGWTHPRTFNDDDRQLFNAFASRAGLAIQNALLFEQAQAAASMEERQRIARELHDSVSQALYGIGLGARTALRRLGEAAPPDVREPVDYIVQLAESGLAETRALIFELVPESLEQQGLVLALQRQAAATQSRFRVEVAAYLAEEPDIPVRSKEALYRICQESLHNMAKHAHASHASVTLKQADGTVSLVIEDDGQGFDTGADFPGHLGLKTMAERARRIGGQYTIQSEIGKGTRVSVVVPAG